MKRMENPTGFRRFGTMLDCSRNAVMTVDALKRWIDLTADLGYNTLLLYMEDTYEIQGQPYFGYMRGRYTGEELKEADRYARSRGMELIPCIQTLAHLNAIVRWPAYQSHVDTGDILLAGDEAVYKLIDRMFATMSECFESRTVNIGMDEAHMIGRGKYYDLHGDSDRSQILIEHVKRVAGIGKKYGLTLAMWSDMFFRLAAGGEYYAQDVHIDESIRQQIPDNVELIYWDYYSTDKARYDGMLSAHNKLKEGTWFAGGLWTWMGFAPHNGYSMKATEAALGSCREQGIQDVFLTMWGDNGGECSRFALLPALFYAAELARGNDDEDSIREKFAEKYGISFDEFLLLDLPDTPGVADDHICNAEKYLLYNDCFTGLFDTTLAGDEGARYAACGERIGKVEKTGEWSLLFETQKALCEVLELKAQLGVRTREVYAALKKAGVAGTQDTADKGACSAAECTDGEGGRKDTGADGSRRGLEELLSDYRKLLERLEVFYRAYRRQWFAENKPHGFDVQDIRLGGLSRRIQSCLDRLEELSRGRIQVIEELEEEQLDIRGENGVPGEALSFNIWSMNVTANVV